MSKQIIVSVEELEKMADFLEKAGIVARGLSRGVATEDDPGLADTLAILSNDEVKAEIDAGLKEVKAGNTKPVKTVLDEIRTSRSKDI